MSDKMEQYESTIKELCEVICKDRDISNAEAVALFDVMRRSAEVAINAIAGKKAKKSIKLLRKSS